MKAARILRAAALLASTALIGIGVAATRADLEQAMAADGLAETKIKDIDMAFTRPGASLAGYSKVIVDPVEVSFSKSWDPNRTGSRLKITQGERDNIRNGVAKIVQDEFAVQLQAKNGYPVVKEPGPDVLRARAKIVNLYVNAPDTASAGRSRVYTVSAGEMTLYLELYDSETGQILARVIDRREARNAGTMQLSGSVVNAGEAQDIAAIWARILRKSMDKAHAANAAKQG